MGLYDRDYMRNDPPSDNGGDGWMLPGKRKTVLMGICLILALAGLLAFLLTGTP